MVKSVVHSPNLMMSPTLPAGSSRNFDKSPFGITSKLLPILEVKTSAAISESTVSTHISARNASSKTSQASGKTSVGRREPAFTFSIPLEAQRNMEQAIRQNEFKVNSQGRIERDRPAEASGVLTPEAIQQENLRNAYNFLNNQEGYVNRRNANIGSGEQTSFEVQRAFGQHNDHQMLQLQHFNNTFARDILSDSTTFSREIHSAIANLNQSRMMKRII